MNDAVRIRSGPGTQYERAGGLAPGECVIVLGRNQYAGWAYIQTTNNVTGWVAAYLLKIDGT
jgi:uncharacterized protein YgiM (DUF1202 family)